MHRRLWGVVPIYTRNLLDDCAIDARFNKSLSQAALAVFDDYVKIRLRRDGGDGGGGNEMPKDSPTGRRRKRRHCPAATKTARTATGAATITNSEKVSPGEASDNDRFFEHQRTNGYHLASSSLSNSPELAKLRERFIPDSVSAYLREACAAPLGPMVAERFESGLGDFGLDLWATVQRGRGARHPDHVHDGAVVSGVYYSSVPGGSAPLLLRRPSVQSLKNKAWNENDIGEDGKCNDGEGSPLFERFRDGSADVVFWPREGQLILFPPWLYHGVPVAEGGEIAEEQEAARVSFAFNLTGAAFAWGDPGDVTRVVRY